MDIYATENIINDPNAVNCWVAGWNTSRFEISEMDGPFASLMINGYWRGITYECFTSEIAANDFCAWWNDKAHSDEFEGGGAEYCRAMHRPNSLFAVALMIAQS